MMASLFKISALCNAYQVRLPFTNASLFQRWYQLSTDGIPVITVPVRLQERIKKIRKKMQVADEERNRRQGMMGNRKVAIVTCKEPKLNHYKGQTYGRSDAIQLASQKWCSRKSVGNFLTIAAYDENPAHSSTVEKKSFDNYGLRKELVEKLYANNINFPTNIQEMAIAQLLKGSNAICAAETGSGKTLAYLLPFIHNVLEYKEVIDMKDIYCSPLVLIIVPGRELAMQIKGVIDRLTNSLHIKSNVLVGGLGTKQMLLNPRLKETDIVVTSLGVFRKLVSSGIYDISRIRHIVIDEADTMFDDSFNADLTEFLKKFKFRDAVPYNPMDPNIGVQLCLMGATLPRSLSTILSHVFPVDSLAKITTPHIHRLMPHVPQTFLRLRKSDKPAKLVELVKGDLRKKHSTIVFSKDGKTCDYVKMMLEENGVKCIEFSGDMHAKLRNGRFAEFQSGAFDVLSCTDLASRGLDTIQVQHVINYDFPNFMSDYIHRAGRVGRVNSVGSGHVTNLISSGHEVELVQKIELAARTAEILPNVNANIKRKLLSNVLGDDYM